MRQSQVQEIVSVLRQAGVLVDDKRATDALAEHFKNEIHIVWTVDDVQSIVPGLSDEAARDVLDEADRRHDAEYGITWDVLREHAEWDDDEDDEDDEEEDENDADTLSSPVP